MRIHDIIENLAREINKKELDKETKGDDNVNRGSYNLSDGME